MSSPPLTIRAVGATGRGGGTDGARPRPSPGRRRRRRSDHPVGVISTSDLVRALAQGCTMTADLGSPLTKERRRPSRRATRSSSAWRRRCSTSAAYVEEFGASIVPGLPARRRRCASGRPMSDWPAASSRQGPPRPATSVASRRCSRSSSPSSASAVWRASAPARTRAILGIAVAGAGSRDAHRRHSPRTRRHRRSRRPRRARISPTTQKYARGTGKARPGAGGASASSSSRSIARAAPNAWRCARPWATTRCS